MNQRSMYPALSRAVILLVVCLLVLAASATALSAQATPPIIQQASLLLWPEYDDPGLLVILSGDLAPGTALPQTIAIPVPANARNIQAAHRDASGNLLTSDWQMVDGKVTYELPTTGFHLEYYVDRPPSGDTRQIDFVFEAPYATQALEVSVQQPARATEFSLTPTAEATSQRADGLTYSLFHRANLAAGDKVPVTIGYTKTGSSLTAPQLAVTSDQTESAVAAAPPPDVATRSTDWLPYALIGVGVVLLLGALAYWYFVRRRAALAPAHAQAAKGTRPASRPTTTSVKPAGPTARPVSAGAAAFCTECGNPLRPDDRFCSQCGTPRK
jgi:hypothetical protein